VPVEIRDLVPAFIDFWSDPGRPWDAYVAAHPEVVNDLTRSGRELDAPRVTRAIAGYEDREALVRSNATRARGWIEEAAKRVGDLLGVPDPSLRAVTMVGVCTSNGWVDHDVLYLALEMITDARLGEVIAAHEIAHVLQIRLAHEPWPDEGPLGLQVFSEGFATAATAELYPEFGLAEHLWFDSTHDDWLAACESHAQTAQAAILRDLGSEDEAVIASFLTLSGASVLPARVGYFIGANLIRQLRSDYAWQEMARWPPNRATNEVRTALVRNLEQ
jgi:hypothetical protein